MFDNLVPILGAPWEERDYLCHFIGTGPAILAGAGISGATSLAGGKKGASAATQASQLQYAAALQALALQQQIRQQNVDELQPFIDFGRGRIPALESRMDDLSRPIDTTLPQFTFQPTMAQLEQTPGYQFTREQGLNAEQARLGAMGLGRSGSAVRGAGQFASGLAAQTWPQVFNANLAQFQTNTNNLLAGRTMDLQQRQQIYNILAGPVGIGLGAAGTLAGSNVNMSNQIASTITGAGAAQASGVVGAANALTGGITGAGNALGGALTNYGMLQYALGAQQPGVYGSNYGAGQNVYTNPYGGLG